MGQLAGKSGYAALGNSNFAFSSWTADVQVDVLDITNFTSGGFKENIAGLAGAKITARGPYNSGAMAITAGSTYAMVLGMSASVTFNTTARIETISVTTDVTKP